MQANVAGEIAHPADTLQIDTTPPTVTTLTATADLDAGQAGKTKRAVPRLTLETVRKVGGTARWVRALADRGKW
jgi:ribosomal protein L11